MKYTTPMKSIFLLFAAAFAAEPTTYFNTGLTSQVYSRNDGWAEDKAIKVYTFTNPMNGTAQTGLVAAPIYVFRRDTDPKSTPVQKNLIPVAPGDPGYSDLWNVTVVTVPANVTDVITSYSQLATLITSKQVTLSYPNVLVNCPVVHQNSTLDTPSDAKDVTGYYNGQLVHYFDFGVNGAGNGNNNLEKVYVILDSTGNPSGNHVFPGIPGEDGYTAFWYVTTVTTKPGYVANTITSSGATSQGTQNVKMPLTIVNCPVVFVSNSSNGSTNTMTGTTKNGASQFAPSFLALIALLL
ncbi:hypothetical protein HK103_001288 [Boothiomyces macroporosus]|uniref:DUF7482 domain-containing protein n=1 Tax=Boothiomyces macroporosus TaxID=261099 RepID=A0AAD5UAS4_9FUNG|nr:hypothetical protein HK103_001288 [Boothiomyces macroporosus]